MNNLCKLGVMTLVLMSATLLRGQGPQDRNKIKSLKIAFITERLSLSSSEAEAFWPRYNAYEDKRDALQGRQHREVYDKIKNSGSLDEKEAKNLLDLYIAMEAEEEKIDKDFYLEMAKALSAKKTLLLFQAEHDFRRQLIRQMRNKPDGNRN